eukprot:12890993-Prorocentrum_lima.AAC.1
MGKQPVTGAADAAGAAGSVTAVTGAADAAGAAGSVTTPVAVKATGVTEPPKASIAPQKAMPQP